MNQTQFEELCQGTARALHAELSRNEEEAHFRVGDAEMLLVFDETHDADALYCYIDLGEPPAQDRAAVCERLLQLNLEKRERPDNFYAFDSSRGHAIFCVRLSDADQLEADYLSSLMEYFLNQADPARQMILDLQRHTDTVSMARHVDLSAANTAWR